MFSSVVPSSTYVTNFNIRRTHNYVKYLLSVQLCYCRVQVFDDTAPSGQGQVSNLLRAGKLIREAASKGAQVIALPVSSAHLDKIINK